MHIKRILTFIEEQNIIYIKICDNGSSCHIKVFCRRKLQQIGNTHVNKSIHAKKLLNDVVEK